MSEEQAWNALEPILVIYGIEMDARAMQPLNAYSLILLTFGIEMDVREEQPLNV